MGIATYSMRWNSHSSLVIHCDWIKLVEKETPNGIL